MKNPRPSCLVRIIEPLEWEDNKLLSGVKLFKVLKNVVADAWWWGNNEALSDMGYVLEEEYEKEA